GLLLEHVRAGDAPGELVRVEPHGGDRLPPVRQPLRDDPAEGGGPPGGRLRPRANAGRLAQGRAAPRPGGPDGPEPGLGDHPPPGGAGTPVGAAPPPLAAVADRPRPEPPPAPQPLLPVVERLVRRSEPDPEVRREVPGVEPHGPELGPAGAGPGHLLPHPPA